ncbi:MAG: hypothetical protein ABI134_12820, partial [Byssovorax sp.]
ELLGSIERGPAGAEKSPAVAANPPADAKPPPAGIAPAAIAPAKGSGCATCTVGGDREGSAPALSLAVTGLLAIAYGARRARRRTRR